MSFYASFQEEKLILSLLFVLRSYGFFAYRSANYAPFMLDEAVGLLANQRSIMKAKQYSLLLSSCFKPKVVTRGVPDITAISSKGVYVGVEAKTLRDVVSDDQLRFSDKVRANRGYYFFVRSTTELVEQLVANGLIS